MKQGSNMKDSREGGFGTGGGGVTDAWPADTEGNLAALTQAVPVASDLCDVSVLYRRAAAGGGQRCRKLPPPPPPQSPPPPADYLLCRLRTALLVPQPGRRQQPMATSALAHPAGYQQPGGGGGGRGGRDGGGDLFAARGGGSVPGRLATPGAIRHGSRPVGDPDLGPAGALRYLKYCGRAPHRAAP
ncbi:homeobox protein engrailed-2-like [Schistocerca gregaria]|uniref:homeobox protein engrailed-2-like n=1 Tax=Schistocerca gregaria TaxID=7010 RepID=UPI00211E108B|nr:homeobox protein engrailed-2-like [Schistocerca gregaria]